MSCGTAKHKNEHYLLLFAASLYSILSFLQSHSIYTTLYLYSLSWPLMAHPTLHDVEWAATPFHQQEAILLPIPQTNNSSKADPVLGMTCSSTRHCRRTPKDFILISEFSELEGPLALAVVAASTYIDLKEEQHLLDKQLQQLDLDEFDFNAFALRVVSVDQTAE